MSKKPPISIEKFKIESSIQSPLDSKMKEMAKQDIEDSSKVFKKNQKDNIYFFLDFRYLCGQIEGRRSFN